MDVSEMREYLIENATYPDKNVDKDGVEEENDEFINNLSDKKVKAFYTTLTTLMGADVELQDEDSGASFPLAGYYFTKSGLTLWNAC